MQSIFKVEQSFFKYLFCVACLFKHFFCLDIQPLTQREQKIQTTFDLLQEQQTESTENIITNAFKNLSKELEKYFYRSQSSTDKIISIPLFIEGKILRKEEQFPSTFTSEQLIVKLTEEHQLYSNMKFLTNTKMFIMSTTRKIVKNFWITDDDYSKKCEVKIPENQKFLDVIIQFIGQRKVKYPKTAGIAIKKVFSLIAHLIVRVATLGLIQIRGMKIGYIEKEFGLTLHTNLLFYTKIIFNFKTQTLKIKNPIAIMTEKCSFLKGLKFKRNLLVLPLVLSTSQSLYFANQLFKLYRKYKKFQMIEDNQILTENLNDESKCIICFSAPRSLILKPCKHLALCKSCHQQLEKNQCPICKSEIQGYIEIYFRK